jgi:hypothetical protein
VGGAEPGGYTLDMTDHVKPSEQRGGTTAGPREAAEKGDWAAAAAGGGVVPAELGGSDAPPDDREGGPVGGALGETTGSDVPATSSGIDLAAGDSADAVTDGGAEPPAGVEPDLKDAAAMPRKVDLDSSV